MRALVLLILVPLMSCSDKEIGNDHVYKDPQGRIIATKEAERMLAASRSAAGKPVDPLLDAAAQEALIRRRNGWKASGSSVRMQSGRTVHGPLDAKIEEALSKRRRNDK